MKRRKKIKILPINRCLLFRKSNTQGKQGQSSLAEKLGLKTMAADEAQAADSGSPVHWMDAPRYPQWQPENPVARIFAMAARNNHPMTFRYHGGSAPGAKRTIYPAGVFTVGVGDCLYVSGWCMNTESHRTFRVDRIELAIKS